MKSGCCFFATLHVYQKSRWREDNEMQPLSQVQSQPMGETIWGRFQEALGWNMLPHPPTEANLKSTRYVRAVKDEALAHCGILFSFFLIKLKKMPRENTTKETIKPVDVFWRRRFWKIALLFHKKILLWHVEMCCAQFPSAVEILKTIRSTSCGFIYEEQAQTCLGFTFHSGHTDSLDLVFSIMSDLCILVTLRPFPTLGTLSFLLLFFLSCTQTFNPVQPVTFFHPSSIGTWSER